MAEAQLRLRERYGYDNVWSLFYVGREAELLGWQAMIYSAEGPPNVGHMVMKCMADVDQVIVPDDVVRHPAFEQPARRLQLLRREVGGRYPICAYLTSTMTLPAMVLGMEKWMPVLLGPPTFGGAGPRQSHRGGRWREPDPRGRRAAPGPGAAQPLRQRHPVHPRGHGRPRGDAGGRAGGGAAEAKGQPRTPVLAAGFDGFIPTPVQFSALIAEIERHALKR